MSELSNDTPAEPVTLHFSAGRRAATLLRRWLACFTGLGSAALGVLAFSLTVPATRAAVPELGALFVGAGRSVIAGALALGVLWVRREPVPQRADLGSLVLVALGAVFGFPLCSAMAVGSVPAAHALVIIGLVPMATALLAALRDGEQPGKKFWQSSALGTAAVIGFGLSQSSAQAGSADAWMLLAVLSAAFGYGEGARLSRRLGGWRVISWALVLSLPFTLGLSTIALIHHPLTNPPSWRALTGFGYVGVVSMYLAYFAWYRGLTRTTVARASQVQLAQPVLGLFWCWLFLGEHVTGPMLLTASVVLVCAGWASHEPVVKQQRILPDNPARSFHGGLARPPGAFTPRA